MVKRKAMIIAPPVAVVFDEAPVNATTEDFGDDELPDVVEARVAVVDGELGRDCVLHCGVGDVPIDIVDMEEEE